MLSPKSLAENSPLLPGTAQSNPDSIRKAVRAGFLWELLHFSGMAPSDKKETREMIQKPCNKSCGRYQCSWRLFSCLSPSPLRGWIRKCFWLVESQLRGLQNLPLLPLSSMPPNPSDCNCPQTPVTAVAALVQLWEGLPGVLADTEGTGQQYRGPEDISTQRRKLILIWKC